LKDRPDKKQTSAKMDIHEVSDREAQELANIGYVVIGAWKNKPGKENSPHYATVHPGNFSEGGCPWVANVGEHNGIFMANDVKAFGKDNYQNVKWYYNLNQRFQEKYEKIEEVKRENEKY
jgi:hypothetical protein